MKGNGVDADAAAVARGAGYRPLQELAVSHSVSGSTLNSWAKRQRVAKMKLGHALWLKVDHVEREMRTLDEGRARVASARAGLGRSRVGDMTPEALRELMLSVLKEVL